MNRQFEGQQSSTPETKANATTQQVIGRWDNEGGAGPDGPQEGAHQAGSKSQPDAPELKQAASISTQRWSQNLSGGAHVLIRPINKLDANAERAFIDGLSSDAKRLRFMAQIHPTEKFIAQLTNLDGINEVALVAVTKDGAAEKIVGVSRYSNDVQQNRCECALAVSDDWQHKGLGTALMKHLIEVARSNRIAVMESFEFAENMAMRTLLHELDFHVRLDPNDARQVVYTLILNPQDVAAAEHSIQISER